MSPSFRGILFALAVILFCAGTAVLLWRIEKRQAIQSKFPRAMTVNGRTYRATSRVRWNEEGEQYDAMWRRIAYTCMAAGAVIGLVAAVTAPTKSREKCITQNVQNSP